MSRLVTFFKAIAACPDEASAVQCLQRQRQALRQEARDPAAILSIIDAIEATNLPEDNPGLAAELFHQLSFAANLFRNAHREIFPVPIPTGDPMKDLRVSLRLWCDKVRGQLEKATPTNIHDMTTTQADSITNPLHEWTPPADYVSWKAISSEPQYRKKGKNPPLSTLQKWTETDVGEGRIKRVQAPDRTVWVPRTWIKNRLLQWKPQGRKRA